MAFAPDDPIHVRGIGKGIVREVRNGGRYLVEVNGRSIVTTADQLTAQESAPKRKKTPLKGAPDVDDRAFGESVSLDLHGLTVNESMEAVAAFVNDALLAGVTEARIIHGRSGGKLKASVHAQLKRIASIRSYAVDPRNEGVTIVKF